MKVIWKYLMPDPGATIIHEMPTGAQFLAVQRQGDSICLWALVDPESQKEPRAFAVLGTGWYLPNYPGQYIGTVQADDLVWHVFQVWYDTNLLTVPA